jgi:Phage Tail Collar Domain
MPNTGGRLDLPYPQLSDNADVPEDMGLLALALEGNGLAKYDQGLLAGRPISSAASPGEEGRWYYATDTGRLYYDYGLGWADVSGPHAGFHDPLTGIDKVRMSLGGVLSSRPAAGDVAEGTHFFATDQMAEYAAYSSVWYRISVPAGSVMDWFAAVAPAGWVAYNGGQLPAATGIYADLYAHLGNSLQLPDTRGRVTVGQGTHADVDGIGDSDGIGTVASRRPKHKHTINGLTGALVSTGGGTVAGGGQGTYTDQPATSYFTIGPQADSPTDGPAWITCLKIAKL